MFPVALMEADVEPVAHVSVAILAFVRAIHAGAEFLLHAVEGVSAAGEPVGPALGGETGEVEREHDFADDAGGDDLGGEAVVVGPRRLRAGEILAGGDAKGVPLRRPRARIGGDAGEQRVRPLRPREREFPCLRRGRFLQG